MGLVHQIVSQCIVMEKKIDINNNVIGFNDDVQLVNNIVITNKNDCGNASDSNANQLKVQNVLKSLSTTGFARNAMIGKQAIFDTLYVKSCALLTT